MADAFNQRREERRLPYGLIVGASVLTSLLVGGFLEIRFLKARVTYLEHSLAITQSRLYDLEDGVDPMGTFYETMELRVDDANWRRGTADVD